MINELLPPDAGEIRIGAKVQIGYYDQEHHVLHMDKTIFEEISDDYPSLSNTEIRNTLAAFLFTGDDVFKQIKTLSGGERGRVSLTKLMLSEANFLILDEPTNHLDIVSKEILEDALNGYTGTVLYVSHDRYFINKTASRILELDHKALTTYLGNYDYYLEKKAEQPEMQLSSDRTVSGSVQSIAKTPDASDSQSKQDWKSKKEQQAAQRKKENAIQKCEAEITDLEARNTEIEQQMALPEICTDVAKLQTLSQEKESNDSALSALYEKWEALSE